MMSAIADVRLKSTASAENAMTRYTAIRRTVGAASRPARTARSARNHAAVHSATPPTMTGSELTMSKRTISSTPGRGGIDCGSPGGMGGSANGKRTCCQSVASSEANENVKNARPMSAKA